MSDLMGRLALVIGGAAGIGQATSLLMAARGAHVLVADRSGAGAQCVMDEVIAAGGIASAYEVDFANLANLQTLFDQIAGEHGKLDIFFSNVGSRCASGFDITETDFDDAIAINLKSHFFATNLATPLLRRGAPHASIIYMASGAGLRFFGRSPLYSISKSALLMMMRAFSRELASDGIRVNAVCPGPVETSFPLAGVDPAQQRIIIDRLAKDIPLGRVAQPEDVARVVAFLASDESAYLTGLTVPIDGGAMA